MPVASETVPNRALSTIEVRELITRDFTRLLDGLSVLNSCAAFGRVSWNIHLTIHTEQQPYEIELGSKPQPKSEIVDDGIVKPFRRDTPPSWALVEAHPLQPSEATPAAAIRKLSKRLSRNVKSPNAERLREGLPVPVDVRDTSGQIRTETIAYQPDPSMEQDVTLSDD